MESFLHGYVTAIEDDDVIVVQKRISSPSVCTKHPRALLNCCSVELQLIAHSEQTNIQSGRMHWQVIM